MKKYTKARSRFALVERDHVSFNGEHFSDGKFVPPLKWLLLGCICCKSTKSMSNRVLYFLNSKNFKLNQHELQKNSKYIFIYYWPKKAERVQQLSTAMAMLWDINEMTWGAPNQSKILSMWYIAFLDKFSSFWCNSGTETSGNPFLNLVLHHYFILIGSFDFWNVREKSFIWQLWWDQQHNLSWI